MFAPTLSMCDGNAARPIFRTKILAFPGACQLCSFPSKGSAESEGHISLLFATNVLLWTGNEERTKPTVCVICAFVSSPPSQGLKNEFQGLRGGKTDPGEVLFLSMFYPKFAFAGHPIATPEMERSWLPRIEHKENERDCCLCIHQRSISCAVSFFSFAVGFASMCPGKCCVDSTHRGLYLLQIVA